MIHKRFRVQCIVRVVFIGATMLLALYLFTETTSYVAAVMVALAVVYQLAALVRYVEHVSRELSRFLSSIRYSDFSQTFTGQGRGPAFEQLGKVFTDVMDDFRAARAEKEEHYRYLHTVMQHVGIGLVSFEQNGAVGLVNTAAKRLLRVTRLKNVGELGDFSPHLVETLLRLRSGEKALVQVVDDDELLQVSVYATEFKLRGTLFKLVSLQNIQSELEEKEIEAWQKLTRVLTHEIMNSVTPIASLAATVNELLVDIDENAVEDGETIGDVRGAMRTIERRSQGLLNFVNAYRSLTRIPRPNFQIFPLKELFDNVSALMRPEMDARGIRFTCRIEPASLDLTADAEMIEQVLLNLVKNAMDAVAETSQAEVRLHAGLDGRGRPIIQVIDNGPGIVVEALDKIFIPFFSTKKEGSGIGLSLSRQIMRQHGGTLSALSEPNERTVFTMRF